MLSTAEVAELEMIVDIRFLLCRKSHRLDDVWLNDMKLTQVDRHVAVGTQRTNLMTLIERRNGKTRCRLDSSDRLPETCRTLERKSRAQDIAQSVRRTASAGPTQPQTLVDFGDFHFVKSAMGRCDAFAGETSCPRCCSRVVRSQHPDVQRAC